jgi:hypothetical protein
MALFVSRSKEYTFVPFSERGKDDAFTVVISSLDSKVLALLDDGYVIFGGEESITLKQGTYNLKALKYGIKSWSNLTDGETDYPIKKNAKGEVLDECLALLPPAVIAEIANAIVAVSKFPENADTILGNIKKTEAPEVSEETTATKKK